MAEYDYREKLVAHLNKHGNVKVVKMVSLDDIKKDTALSKLMKPEYIKKKDDKNT